MSEKVGDSYTSNLLPKKFLNCATARPWRVAFCSVVVRVSTQEAQQLGVDLQHVARLYKVDQLTIWRLGSRVED